MSAAAPGSILIVGAGPGIGQAVAERFGSAGWTVILAARGAERVRAAADALGTRGIRAFALPLDCTDPASLRAGITEADRLAGGLTAVHYNAARVRHQDLFSMRDDEVTDDLAINVAGGMHTIRGAVQQFDGRPGTILVTGGGLAIAPDAAYASLGLCKAALRNLVQGLAGPLAARGIRIAIATVATPVAPASPEAREVADVFWGLATSQAPSWEAVYPAPGDA